MKKIVILLVGLVGLAGCSNNELIECNTERQELRLQVDELNQKMNDWSISSYQEKTNAEMKIGSLESALGRKQQELDAAKQRLLIELPDLQKSYDAVKSQLDMANAAMREELAKSLASQKDIQELKATINALNETISQKEVLLKEANVKLQELAEALKAKTESEKKVETEQSQQ